MKREKRKTKRQEKLDAHHKREEQQVLSVLSKLDAREDAYASTFDYLSSLTKLATQPMLNFDGDFKQYSRWDAITSGNLEITAESTPGLPLSTTLTVRPKT